MRSPGQLGKPPLIRSLQGLAPEGFERPQQDVAQQLGDWLSAVDSIQLDGALQAIQAFAAQTRSAGQPVDVQAMQELLARARRDLQAQIVVASQPTAAEDEPELDYSAHHKRYQDLQKQMGNRVTLCRAQLRQAMSKGSPRLRQLVAMDAVMEKLFGEREQRLMGAVPVLLEKRFLALREQTANESGGSALAQAFAQDMQAMLDAELQARWLPLQGLLEAAQEDIKKT
jgi:hypothetical protein